MKISVKLVQKIIQEELTKVLKEQNYTAATAVADDTSYGQTEFPPEMQQSMMRTTMPGMEDMPTMADLAAKKEIKRDALLMDLQRELRRLGATDQFGNQLAVDGLAGPKTAIALSAALPAFKCVGKECKESAKFLKKPELLRAAKNVLKKMQPFDEDYYMGRLLALTGDGSAPTEDQMIADIETGEIPASGMEKIKSAPPMVEPIEKPPTTVLQRK